MRTTNNLATATHWKEYAAGAHDLANDSDGPGHAARKIVLKEAGNLTACVNPSGDDSPLTGLPAWFEHVGAVSSVESTAAFIAYW